MSALLPAAVYGLEVPAGDVMIPAAADFPSAFRITMAALDPTAAPEHHASLGENPPARATLKLIRVPLGEDESDEDSEDDELDALINGEDSDEDSENEANGGPSDPAKSKKAKREAAVKALKQALAGDDEDDEDEEMGGVNGKVDKGKAVALDMDDDDEDEDGEDLGLDEYVVCTLDPERHYQQPLDITIGENETVYFKVIGTHGIYLTGNYVMPVDDSTPRGYDDEDEDDEYDLDEDELDYDEDEESDDLDDLEDPRITELDDDEDAAPKLIAAAKSSKKRAAEEQGLDELIAKEAANGASKKQQKKLKNNSGEASAAPAAKDDKKSDKKVQFAKELEQGPTGSAADKKAKKEDKKQPEKKTEEKPATGIRTVQGVKIDDRKAGSGPKAKKGSMIGMRYIGKLENGQVFDSNKKGKPFTFKLGAGNVIKGWDIGVEGMAVGGERRITVPAKLAYGNQAVPGIPKNSTLIFDLKLIDLK